MWVTRHATPTAFLHQCRSNNAIIVLSPAEAVRSRVPEFGVLPRVSVAYVSFLSGLSCWPTRNDQHKSLEISGRGKRHGNGMTSDDIDVSWRLRILLTSPDFIFLRRSPTATAPFQPSPKNSEPTLPRIASISSVRHVLALAGTVSDTTSSRSPQGFHLAYLSNFHLGWSHSNETTWRDMAGRCETSNLIQGTACNVSVTAKATEGQWVSTKVRPKTNRLMAWQILQSRGPFRNSSEKLLWRTRKFNLEDDERHQRGK